MTMNAKDWLFILTLGLTAYLTACSGIRADASFGLREETSRDENIVSKTRNTSFRCRFVNCQEDSYVK